MKNKNQEKKSQKIGQIKISVYNYIVEIKKPTLLYSYKTAMENKIQKLETLQIKAKGLWKSYMKTNDVFKSSLYLKKRNHAMNEILKIEHEISKLLLDDLSAND